MTEGRRKRKEKKTNPEVRKKKFQQHSNRAGVLAGLGRKRERERDWLGEGEMGIAMNSDTRGLGGLKHI